MLSRFAVRSTLLLAACVMLSPSAQSEQDAAIRGFTAAGAQAEREVERRFQAVPSPANLREYMQAIAKEPHHAGSPGSRKVAEYVLGKFLVLALLLLLADTVLSRLWGSRAARRQSGETAPPARAASA